MRSWQEWNGWEMTLLLGGVALLLTVEIAFFLTAG